MSTKIYENNYRINKLALPVTVDRKKIRSLKKNAHFKVKLL